MDIATLLGFVGAFAVVLMAVLMGGSMSLVINVPSLMIVVAGSSAIVLMKFSLGQFFGAVKIAMKTVFYKTEKPTDIIDVILEIADQARKNGMLALESIEVKNTFLKQATQYLIDGVEADFLENTLYNEMVQTLERHSQGQQIFKAMGEVGPAMGMIGTLIGLVQMLSNMSDPQSLGPAMAVAMLTTLYGAILANMIAIPIADKLELRSKEERLQKLMIIDAALAIQKGQNPRVIRDLLKVYLPGKNRDAGEDKKPDEDEKVEAA